VKIYSIDDIRPHLNKRAVIDVVRDALIRHARGEVQSPMPGHLLFEEANGDCHIKYGQMAGSPNFAIKVATGFYDNGKRGLPVSNGLIMVFDAQTGAPVSLFQDEGWLTAWRTGAATALAAHILAPKPECKVGVFGTGLQGQLAVEWIAELMPDASFAICGRDASRTQAVASELSVAASPSAEDMLATCDIIVTATPSAHALFDATCARPGMHFVGVGADGPEKHELPEALFAHAAVIATDDHAQCMALGDFGRAVRAGQVDETADQSLGTLLSISAVDRPDKAITVIDLTGIAAQDIAIVNLFAEAMA
jgi:ornithine cyclodeaminase/alanine dehydrogenase-like protein (mu-crystallin family)